MAATIPNDLRDQLISAFRERICEKLNVAPFLHQRQVWAASDGLELTGELLDDSDRSGLSITLDDKSRVRAAYRRRNEGRARFLADLGAFKIGKSYGAALWASGFAAVPDARVNLVGLEYDICEPEFSYLVEFLLSERGMNLKANTLSNNSRNGKMYLDLANGASFVCRSWERKDSLKGKEIDAYIYCEAYQLPGMECFTGFSQNLRARRGYAYFATTPDRPWIKLLHEMGHGRDPEWYCACSIPAESNPYTFDPVAKRRDASLMTKEKYAIHYEGKLGDFIGHVFNYQRGERIFNSGSHPYLFSGGGDRAHLRIPDGWALLGGADTGTHYSGLLVAFSPEGEAFVVEEFPNYRYVGGAIERDESITIPQWASALTQRTLQLGGHPSFWADPNSQFKAELRNYGISLMPQKSPVESRTEVTREYFQHNKIWLAPWISVLGEELELASWPEEASLSGKFGRVKDRDHTLDCLEHVLSRRPFGRVPDAYRLKGSWAAANYKPKAHAGNVHLGSK